MSRFDDILGAAASQQGKGREPKQKAEGSDARAEFWADLEKPDRKATIKLSVSVPLPLNEKIEEKARAAGISKNELINKMLAYLLE